MIFIIDGFNLLYIISDFIKVLVTAEVNICKFLEFMKVEIRVNE